MHDRHEGHGARRPAPTASTSRRRRADGKTETLKAEYLLVATGRGPVTDGLGAEDAGLELERGYIKVDDAVRHQRARASRRSAT